MLHDDGVTVDEILFSLQVDRFARLVTVLLKSSAPLFISFEISNRFQVSPLLRESHSFDVFILPY